LEIEIMETLLITDKDLIKGSPIEGNISIAKYRAIIEEVQIFTIENVLGTLLYEKIKTEYLANTLAGLYLTMHTDYIKPIIINMVVAEYVIISRYVINNAGVHVRTPEDMTPASSKEVSSYSSRFSARAEVFEERLQRFLTDQGSNITEYTSDQTNNYDIKPDKDMNLYGGFYLPDEYQPDNSLEREIWKDINYDLGNG